MNKSRAQGALEYLLLIGGGILVATVILIIALQTAPQGSLTLNTGINTYLNQINLNSGSGGGGTSQCGTGGQFCAAGSTQACTTTSGYSGTQSCNSTCTGFDTCLSTQSCGDGAINGLELCDTLGNVGCTGGDTCNGTCTACLPPSGDTTPPSIASFTATPGDFLSTLNYTVSDNVGVTAISIARAKTNISAIGGFQTPPYTGFDPPLATTVAAASVFSGSSPTVVDTFTDEAVANGMRYFYAIRACDAAGNCSISFSGQMLMNVAGLAYSFSFGTPETVFDQDGGNPSLPTGCATMDFPDLVTRAFRDAANKIVLYAVNAPDNYEMVSRFANNFSAANFQRQCTTPIITSETMPQLNKYHSLRWLAAPYTEDGTNVHALIYDEYHDPYFGNPCTLNNPDPGNPCMYTSTGLATSTNGGDTYSMAASPNHLVATVSTDWNPTLNNPPAPVYGVMIPTNIVKNNGYYYSVVSEITQPSSSAHRGNCLMRTTDLSTPNSWRFYNGALQIGPRASWYDSVFTTSSFPIVGHSECGFMDIPSSHGTTGTVTYNTYLNRYFLVAAGPATGNCHFYYMTSKDLIHWSTPQVFKDTPDGANCSLFQNSEMYPAIIDHADSSRNFEYSGQSAWLYYVKMIDNAINRDLERVQFTIT